MKDSTSQRMSVLDALTHLSRLRTERDIIVSNQSSARLFPRISEHPLDFHYNPSTMGGAVPLGIGLAVAQPNRHVIVLTGDGSLLMSLGCLVTTAASGATNLSVLLLDNGMYEVTGGQKTAASDLAIDYAAAARACGIPTTTGFDSLENWQEGASGFFTRSGPRFAALRVGPTPSEAFTTTLPPIDQRAKQLADQLRVRQDL